MQSKVDLFKREWKVKRKKNVIRPQKYSPPKKKAIASIIYLKY